MVYLYTKTNEELSSFDETKAGYDGIWTKVEDLFELYLPTERKIEDVFVN